MPNEMSNIVARPLTQFNLQLFAEDTQEGAPQVNTVNALDALISGNTTDDVPAVDDKETDEEETLDTDVVDDSTEDVVDNGGDDTSDSGETPETKPPTDAKASAAFAKMRTENKKLSNTIAQIAEALGIDAAGGDISDNLLELATQKLAEKKELPVEVYKELNNTKEQLNKLQQAQNIETARGKLDDIKNKYNLKPQDLGKFLDMIEAEGINPIADPMIDLEYHYYRLNKDAILADVKEKARQEAIKNSSAGNGNKPSKLSSKSKPTDDKDDKSVTSVSGLNALLDSK